MGTSCRRILRTTLAGSLLFGAALTVAVVGGSLPVGAAAVVRTITVGRVPTPFPPTAPTSGWRTRAATTVTEINASTGAVVQTIGVGSVPTPCHPTAPTSGWRTSAATR